MPPIVTDRRSHNVLSHIRAILWLLFLTLAICSGVYPLTLWAIARLPMFQVQAEGSLLTDRDGTIVGSRLIAQPFSGDAYFLATPVGCVLQRHGFFGVQLGGEQLSVAGSRGSHHRSYRALWQGRRKSSAKSWAKAFRRTSKLGSPGTNTRASPASWPNGLRSTQGLPKPGPRARMRSQGTWKANDVHAMFFDMWRARLSGHALGTSSRRHGDGLWLRA